MRAKSVILLAVILFEERLSHTGNAQDVTCVRQQDAACFYETVSDIPWSDSSSKPAPVVECLSASVEYDADSSTYDYIEPTSFNIRWKQKRIDMNAIEGYFIDSISLTGREHYELKLDKEKLLNDVNSSEKYISFNFRELGYFDDGALYLYSIPMYNNDSKDHHQSIIKDEKGIRSSKSCSPVREEASPPPTGSQYTPTGRPKRTEAAKSTQVVSLRITILACILTSVGTLILLLVIFISFATQCKLREFHRRTDGAKRVKEDYKPGKLNLIRMPPSKVFMLTTMEEEEGNDASTSFHKKAALGLAEILCDSNLYEVSCNLWMTKEISDNGVGVWAHRMMTSHDVIIALCNSFTVAGLRRWLDSDIFSKEQSGQDTEPSVLVLQRFIRNLPPGKKRIIVCMEESQHDCLGRLDLPSLEKWKSFNLNYQFAEFIAATHSKGECFDGDTTARMRSSFLRMMMKYKSEYHPRALGTIRSNEVLAPPSYEAMEKESKNFRIQPRAKSYCDSCMAEVQYDSVLSSRCNSHSTETVSSCGDTRLRENAQQRVKHDFWLLQAVGARSKVQ